MKRRFGGDSVVRHSELWFVALLLALLGASSARAGTAVVVPPTVDMAAGPETVEIAVSELVRSIRVQGFDVISPGQAGAAAEDAQRTGGFAHHINPNDCRTADCATEYRRLFDASFAVQLKLSGLAGKVRLLSVTITESPTATFTGTASVQGGDLKGAVQTAYGLARDKHVRGEGPWLSVSGTPAGAVVYVDGLEYGTVPFERRYVEGGNHRVEVRADGFITQGQTVDIPARIDHEERLVVTLAKLGGEAVAGRSVDRTWDYVIGGVLAAAGAVHLGFGIHQTLKNGECTEYDAAGTCTRVYGDDTGVRQDKLLIGLGAGGIALGGIWMWSAPIGALRLRADRNTAALSVSGGF